MAKVKERLPDRFNMQ